MVLNRIKRKETYEKKNAAMRSDISKYLIKSNKINKEGRDINKEINSSLDMDKFWRKAARNKKKTFNESLNSLLNAGQFWSKRNDKLQDIRRIESNKHHDNGVQVPLQDNSGKAILLGSDVAALYPSLDQVGTAELTYKAICESDIKYDGINYNLLAVYLFLILGYKGMIDHNLEDIIPSRTDNKYANVKSLSAQCNRKLSNWNCDTDNKLDNMDNADNIKRRMVGAMLKICVLVLFDSTCYTFGGDIFKQLDGAGIGLRGAAVLAKLVMAVWDNLWSGTQDNWGLLCELFIRYIDDIRVYIKPINRGWFWECHKWVFDPQRPDSRTMEVRTAEEICKSMNDIMDCLRFTMETEADFESNWLPTLDTQTQVQNNGKILFKFFSKPTGNNISIQYGSALPKNTIFAALRQELVRRMLNTHRDISWDDRIQIVEDFIQVLVDSGHRFSFIKSLILQGLTKYEFMWERSQLKQSDSMYLPIYRPRNLNRLERDLLKCVEPFTWHKDQDLGDPFRKTWRKRINTRKGSSQNDVHGVKITSAIFIPQSRGSKLFEKALEVEKIHKQKFKWGVKLLEQSGTPLVMCFFHKVPMNEGCPRGEKCSLCNNEGVKCSKRGVIYSATCMTRKI